MTSFHLRLGKQGGSQGARPSARGSWLELLLAGPLLATAWETKHAGLPHPCEHRTTTPPPAADRSLPTARGPSRPRAGTNCRLSQYLRGKAPPCGVAPAAPSGSSASYCDLSPSQWPARQLPCPRASSPPEPGLRPRRCHGASFLSVPLHGWSVPGNDSCTPGADSQLTPRGLHALPAPRPNRRAAAPPAAPHRRARGPAPRAPAHCSPLRTQATPLALGRVTPSTRTSPFWVPDHPAPPPLGNKPRGPRSSQDRQTDAPPLSPSAQHEPPLFPPRGGGGGAAGDSD